MKRGQSIRLTGDERGATIVEFACVLPVLCVMLIGIFELGYRSYVASIVQGSLHEAARMATVGGVTPEQIDTHVKGSLRSFSSAATITTRTQSYYDYARVAQPEKLVGDTAPMGAYNRGDCWEDVNGNNRFDADAGRSGLGNAEDIVRYEVTMTYPHMFPVARILGWTGNVTIVSSTVLRNQPFAGRVMTTNRLKESESPIGSGNWSVGAC